MKRIVTLGLAMSLAAAVSTSALACGFNKTASHKTMTTASSSSDIKADEAMSTFDPKVLEESAETQNAEKPVVSE